MGACVIADAGACIIAVIDTGGAGAQVIVGVGTTVAVDVDAAETVAVALQEGFDFEAGPFPFAMGCNHFSSSITGIL